MSPLDRQLAPLAEAMARELSSGAGLVDALTAAGRDLGGVAGRDVARVADLTAAGEPTRSVLRGWARYRRSPDLAVLVALLSVAHESGGDVSHALESFAAGRRDADDLAGELRALTSQARVSATFLVVLPVLAAVGLAVVEPATARFLTATPAGWGCLLAATVLDGSAGWSMRALAHRVSARRFTVAVRSVLPVVDVARLGLAAGMRPPAAFDLAARHLVGVDPACAGALGDARSATERGASFPDVVRSWAAMVGPPAAELAEVLVSSHTTGATVVPALDRLAHDLRRRHRHGAQERARRVPVLMIVPLVLCVLPAFALVSVVPMLVVGLDTLRSTT